MLRIEDIAWILNADTSYSGDIYWYNPDSTSSGNKRLGNVYNHGRDGSRSGRGMKAVSEVILTMCKDTDNLYDVCCHGVLSDGSSYETKPLPLQQHEMSHSIKEGMQTADSETNLVVGELATAPLVPPSAPASSNHSNAQGSRPRFWWIRAAFLDGSYMLTSGQDFERWNYRVTSRIPMKHNFTSLERQD